MLDEDMLRSPEAARSKGRDLGCTYVLASAAVSTKRQLNRAARQEALIALTVSTHGVELCNSGRCAGSCEGNKCSDGSCKTAEHAK